MTAPSAPGPSVAIMQPYVFPYVGYFQLIRSVDHFVVYDDVQFIKGGWINRNRISNQGKVQTFTIPAQGRTFPARIVDVECGLDPRFCTKFLRQIEQEYRKAASFAAVFAMIERVLTGPHQNNMATVATQSIAGVFDLLDLPFNPVVSSRDFPREEGVKGAERVIAITQAIGGRRYINLMGGLSIYTPEQFSAAGIDLRFIFDRSEAYPQFGQTFLPKLSIIDVLMHNEPARVRAMLEQYDLLSAEEAAHKAAPAEDEG